jgi:hypothetical protein
MVEHLDRVGAWGGRSLEHCLWSFMLALWRGPEVLLTPIGDLDDRTPMEVGSSSKAIWPCVGEQQADRYITVYAETSELLKVKSNSEDDDEAIVAPLPPVAEGCVRLNHATSVNSVTNIAAAGIDLLRCPDTSNFGTGFYMTPDLGCAYHFLVLEAPPEPHHHPRALLALDMDSEGLSQLVGLPLLRENHDIWTHVIKRSTGALSRAERAELRRAMVLVGPLTTKRIGRKYLGPSDDEPWLQYCLVEPELIDPKKYLGGLEDSLVRAAYVVRLF